MKNILITGSKGFLGQKLVGEFNSNNLTLFTPTRSKIDLFNKISLDYYLQWTKPDTIIHCAGTVGGIGLNKAEPGRLTYENLLMGINIIEAARHTKLNKFVCIGTTCSYAANCPIPFKEEDFIEFNRTGPGMPETTNSGYGISKRMLYELLLNYNKQYDFPFIYLIPVNMYGPGDHFEENKSHVIPALIKRIHNAKINNQSEVILWGTGNATREFLFVRDAAKAIKIATESYNSTLPLNIGNGVEVSIRELAELICSIVGFNGKLVFDSTKPDGQMRRCMDVTKMKENLGNICQTSLKDGLIETYNWALQNQVL